MPHLVLEYSENIIEKHNLKAFLQDCHVLLATTLPTTIPSCKSRAIECALYCVGEGAPDDAFVHLSLKILAGRSPDKIKQTGALLLDKLKKQFSGSINKLNLEITLEITELANYFKYEK
jgi:5-carboxymethyl-2-hydroxymuconate isomerase